MNPKQTAIQLLVGNIRLSLDEDEEKALESAKQKLQKIGVFASMRDLKVFKRSIDARNKEDVHFVVSVLATLPAASKLPGKQALDRIHAGILSCEDPVLSIGNAHMPGRPLVVGMGPAGLFAALLLAENGYAPILIDRGASVEERVRDTEKFFAEGILDPESNVQFGAGGAGTFSDGKLVTRIKDPLCRFVLDTFVRFGAPEEILLKAKPHVGTDLLRGVVSGMLDEIVRLGGEVRYHCRLDDFSECPDGSLKVKTSQGEFSSGALILAIGHSARDTYQRLLEKSFALEPKPISVGLRAEHLQSEIDESLYGSFAGHPKLGPAEYSLSDTRGERGVYTFCMCPGGEVVAAASEEGGLVVNGMSRHARAGKNANAAVAVSVSPNDIEPLDGNKILGAIAFQRSLERAAYQAGGGDYFAPAMTLGDFMAGRTGTQPSRVLPSYRDGKVRVADFTGIYPEFVLRGLRYGFASFGRQLKGYDDPDTVLTAAETRTSAPLRILRDPEGYHALGHASVYPCGEGAGYAGGITSAAVDGLRATLALMKKFAPSKGDKIP
ncbi:MAG: hypothetical protein IJR88_01640 [Clostridia bacterium]|nr:hypothetical protein [Clostridia bacterium]